MRFRKINDNIDSPFRYKRVFLWLPHTMFWPYGKTKDSEVMQETRWLEYAYVEEYYNQYDKKYVFNRFVTEEVYRYKMLDMESKVVELRDEK